ncbi:hypothetical protein OpiT1DRAFT_00131 [Opitutaceae bacterium TAV1]|nr:hypothetical protein OpiT1DRAFT_00131 [Opitutaceae bacterium TAV1]
MGWKPMPHEGGQTYGVKPCFFRFWSCRSQGVHYNQLVGQISDILEVSACKKSIE